MNILVDIGHPAHVHYFRNLIRELESRGHRIIITIKDISIIKDLLSSYGLSYIVLSSKGRGLYGKILKQLYFDLKLLRICSKEKIDIAIGVSITITHVSLLSKVKSVFFEDDDDEVVPLSVRFGHPFATTILSPDCLKFKQKRKDVIYYPGYHELAYLHPKRFVPDPGVLNELGISINERFFILRFNSLNAHHDSNAVGISIAMKLELIKILREYGRIFITTEGEIEPELKMYHLPISPNKIHSLIYYSTLFIGDSQTMSSEAAVLGVPSLRCNSFAGRISYLKEQEERYGLTYAYYPDRFDQLTDQLRKMISDPDLKSRWQIKREKMLNEKIDVTSFWCWFIENYPSVIIDLRNKPDILKMFK